MRNCSTDPWLYIVEAKIMIFRPAFALFALFVTEMYIIAQA